MGNLTSISSPKKLKFDEVDAQIREINERRFGGFFTIKCSTPESYIGADGWEFHVPEVHPYALFGYALSDTKRRIRGGHARPAFRWADWCVAVFENELGAAWKGRISDDGVEGSWAPVKDKYPDLQAWHDMFDSMYEEPNTEMQAHIKKMQEWENDKVPEALRPYAFPESRSPRLSV